MQYKDGVLGIYDENNNHIECTIISQFRNEDTGKDYLVYTDNTRNELGKKNMYVVSYDPQLPEDTQLRPVETAEEWEEISGFLQELRRVIDEKGLDL